LADNAGYDSSDLVSRLRAAHYEGQTDAGLGKFAYTDVRTYILTWDRYDSRLYWLYDRIGCNGEL
jgi:hypothetical protein